MSALLEVDHLVVEFGEGAARHRAVDDVTLAVQPGESYGLVGESGCGKSTLLRAACGLNARWQGDIRMEGASLRGKRTPAMHRRIQMVFQDPYGSLHPRHT